MHRIRDVALAAALAVGLSACSLYEDMTTSDFAQQDADAIVAAASSAMQGVSSMRVTGHLRSGGTQVYVDLRLDRDDHCTGSIRLGGSFIDIRRVDDEAWVKGEAGAFNRLSTRRLPAAALTRLASSWLPVDDAAVVDLCDLDSLLAGFEVIDYVEPRAAGAGTGRGAGKGAGRDAGKDTGKGAGQDLSGPVPATVVEESSIEEDKVVQLTATPGGQHDELVWVRSEAPHYVVRLESTSADDGGELAFTEFDADVTVRAPERADILRP